jgi:hypothetical protein
MLVHFVIIWNILWPFGIFTLIVVCFAAILVFFPFWYFFLILVYFSRFGILCPEKSGNPALEASTGQFIVNLQP